MGRSEEKNSAWWWERAQELFPGGVNSPVRSFRSVGGTPFFVAQGRGCRIWDVEGKEYVDYICSWGALILGHCHPEVVSAVQAIIERGTSFGAPTALEVTLAERIQEAFPTMERMRMVNSGTEATMSAIRVARGFTKRSKIIKFIGCYHGHADYLLAKAGSGATTFGIPDSAGVPPSLTTDVLILPFNNAEAFTRAMEALGDEIACVIVEPVAGNMGVVPPKWDFLAALRAETKKHGAVLIFDEVITGFRLTYGGAQSYYGIQPDLTCLGKIIGGGFPLAVYGGRKEIMDCVAPVGPVYQAGTLSGNPVAVTAGITTLKVLQETHPYGELEEKGRWLEHALRSAAAQAGVPVQINRVGSMMTIFFSKDPVTDYESATRSSTRAYATFFHGLLERGVFLPPSQFEALFLSTAHDSSSLEKAAEAAEDGFRQVAQVGTD